MTPDIIDLLGSNQVSGWNRVRGKQALSPTSPSSPKPARNGVLGAVVGLIFGVGLTLLLERLDHRVRRLEEVEAIFERPVVGAVPESRTLEDRPGTSGLSLVEAEAFRMLRANLRYFNVDRDARSILVTSAAPGDGKSTISWNLASAGAAAGMRTLVVEADLRHPSFGWALGAADFPGLSSVLAGQVALEEAVRQVAVPDRRNGSGEGRFLEVLLSGPLPPNPTNLIESDRMRDLLRGAEREYDFIVVDTPPASVVPDAIPLVSQVGGVLVVSRLGRTTRGSMINLRDQLSNLAAPVLGVVVNAVGRDRSLSSRMRRFGRGFSGWPPWCWAR